MDVESVSLIFVGALGFLGALFPRSVFVDVQTCGQNLIGKYIIKNTKRLNHVRIYSLRTME